ncbi:WD40-repeat-containing domain protein [Lipomyces oligophaga]|uniref:WD40-repeat-containing domain protein n=1 Tax=Lipomyces oligophaga TaxID=45792 RepID=UPI0034CD4057
MASQYYLQNSPVDIISAVKFNPTQKYSNFLLASSWDATLNLYDTSQDGGRLLTRIDGIAPLLDCAWDQSGKAGYIGGLESKVRRVDLETGDCTVLAQHTGPVKSVLSHENTGLVISGSWDRTVQFNDPRQKFQTGTAQVPHKVFSMDATGNLLVVGMAGRSVYVYDVRNLDEPFQRRESSLKYMTRAIKCIPSGEGYASSSIEGRIAVDFFDPSAVVQAKKYAFKCHRSIETDSNDTQVDAVYPVNALAFHPIYGTFVSGGSDSLVCFWDYKARKRLRQYPKYPSPIQALDISITGSALAIAHGGEVGNPDANERTMCGITVRPLAPGEGKSKS